MLLLVEAPNDSFSQQLVARVRAAGTAASGIVMPVQKSILASHGVGVPHLPFCYDTDTRRSYHDMDAVQEVERRLMRTIPTRAGATAVQRPAALPSAVKWFPESRSGAGLVPDDQPDEHGGQADLFQARHRVERSRPRSASVNDVAVPTDALFRRVAGAPAQHHHHRAAAVRRSMTPPDDARRTTAASSSSSTTVSPQNGGGGGGCSAGAAVRRDGNGKRRQMR